MIKTECPKCKTELTQYDGYGACPKCGEIVGFDVEEEILDEVIEEIPVEVADAEENTEEVPLVSAEPEEEVAEETVQEPEEPTEEVEEAEIPEEKEEIKAPKKKKALIITVIVLIMCALAVSGWYFAKEIYPDMVANTAEKTLPEEEKEEIAEEEPKVIEEPEEQPKAAEETEKPVETPAPAKQEAPKKPTVKKEDAVISPTPSISYRIRKSADDSGTQIGAFSDIEKAKAFASSHAADGYKVYDMNGNVVFEP